MWITIIISTQDMYWIIGEDTNISNIVLLSNMVMSLRYIGGCVTNMYTYGGGTDNMRGRNHQLNNIYLKAKG